MVGKLIKYELMRIARIAAVPAVAVLGLAVIFRISLIGFTDFDALRAVLLAFYILAIVATLVVCGWVGIVRFYRTLFTGEGYMTLSLPVTCDQLIIAKLISSLIAVVCGIVVCIFSGIILFLGQSISVSMIVNEFLRFFGEFIPALTEHYSAMIVVEYVLLAITGIPQSMLIFYLVMSIAQLANKNRVLIAVALYFGGAFVLSTLSTMTDPLVYHMFKFSPHLYIWLLIALSAVVDIACYLAVRHIIKNKVNLLT